MKTSRVTAQPVHSQREHSYGLISIYLPLFLCAFLAGKHRYISKQHYLRKTGLYAYASSSVAGDHLSGASFLAKLHGTQGTGVHYLCGFTYIIQYLDFFSLLFLYLFFPLSKTYSLYFLSDQRLNKCFSF